MDRISRSTCTGPPRVAGPNSKFVHMDGIWTGLAGPELNRVGLYGSCTVMYCHDGRPLLLAPN